MLLYSTIMSSIPTTVYFSIGVVVVILFLTLMTKVFEVSKNSTPDIIEKSAQKIKESIMACQDIDWYDLTSGYRRSYIFKLLLALDKEELINTVATYIDYNFKKWLQDQMPSQQDSIKNRIKLTSGENVDNYISKIVEDVIKDLKKKHAAQGILLLYEKEHGQKGSTDDKLPQDSNEEIVDSTLGLKSAKPDYIIAEGRLTDFTKVIRAMYQCGIILPARKEKGLTKDNCIKAIGGFLGAEFKTEPKQLINAAKNNENYHDVFNDLKTNSL